MYEIRAVACVVVLLAGLTACNPKDPNAPLPSHFVIDRDTSLPEFWFVQALTQSPNYQQTIELGCDVEIDLTNQNPILIWKDHVEIIASPGCTRGIGKPGPLVRIRKHRAEPLFTITGDFVKFSGFRIEGPGWADEEIGVGIRIVPKPDPAAGTECGRPKEVCSIEIDNMEISRFHMINIEVIDQADRDAGLPQGRMSKNTKMDAVHIHDSYIYDASWEEVGYGIGVKAGAYVLISHNVFENNRHAIGASPRNDDGYDYTGYRAWQNLILPTGAEACGGPWNIVCWSTHQFDMHGTGHTAFRTANCGYAGEFILIEGNTFLYDSDQAINIRGNPIDAVIVDGNVFRHDDHGDAIEQSGACDGSGDNITNPIEVRPNNLFGINPMSELGACDFSGDGVNDDFMATGVTWWVRSPAGIGQWHFLNAVPGGLSMFRLRDVDNDGICDVLAGPFKTDTWWMPEEMYSKSGTGPWQHPGARRPDIKVVVPSGPTDEVVVVLPERATHAEGQP